MLKADALFRKERKMRLMMGERRVTLPGPQIVNTKKKEKKEKRKKKEQQQRVRLKHDASPLSREVLNTE